MPTPNFDSMQDRLYGEFFLRGHSDRESKFLAASAVAPLRTAYTAYDLLAPQDLTDVGLGVAALPIRGLSRLRRILLGSTALSADPSPAGASKSSVLKSLFPKFGNWYSPSPVTPQDFVHHPASSMVVLDTTDGRRVLSSSPLADDLFQRATNSADYIHRGIIPVYANRVNSTLSSGRLTPSEARRLKAEWGEAEQRLKLGQDMMEGALMEVPSSVRSKDAFGGVLYSPARPRYEDNVPLDMASSGLGYIQANIPTAGRSLPSVELKYLGSNVGKGGTSALQRMREEVGPDKIPLRDKDWYLMSLRSPEVKQFYRDKGFQPYAPRQERHFGHEKGGHEDNFDFYLPAGAKIMNKAKGGKVKGAFSALRDELRMGQPGPGPDEALLQHYPEGSLARGREFSEIPRAFLEERAMRGGTHIGLAETEDGLALLNLKRQLDMNRAQGKDWLDLGNGTVIEGEKADQFLSQAIAEKSDFYGKMWGNQAPIGNVVQPSLLSPADVYADKGVVSLPGRLFDKPFEREVTRTGEPLSRRLSSELGDTPDLQAALSYATTPRGAFVESIGGHSPEATQSVLRQLRKDFPNKDVFTGVPYSADKYPAIAEKYRRLGFRPLPPENRSGRSYFNDPRQYSHIIERGEKFAKGGYVQHFADGGEVGFDPGFTDAGGLGFDSGYGSDIGSDPGFTDAAGLGFDSGTDVGFDPGFTDAAGLGYGAAPSPIGSTEGPSFLDRAGNFIGGRLSSLATPAGLAKAGINGLVSGIPGIGLANSIFGVIGLPTIGGTVVDLFDQDPLASPHENPQAIGFPNYGASPEDPSGMGGVNMANPFESQVPSPSPVASSVQPASELSQYSYNPMQPLNPTVTQQYGTQPEAKFFMKKGGLARCA